MSLRESQLGLFQVSVLKQAKWRELAAATGPTEGLDALDLGSDNGVISWLFRERGGCWTSADLTDETVHAIEAMVGERVYRLDGPQLPFADAAFDRIVVVDLLEHLVDDRQLLREIGRCLRPGGRAVLNVPHRKPRALLPVIRRALGLTDAWHGHQHAGYTREDIARLLPPELRLIETHTYSRFFSHLLDTALNWAFLRKARGRAMSTAKGMVVTGSTLGEGDARTLGRVYPLMRAFVSLDRAVAWTEGYALLARVEKSPVLIRS
ncbi:MAG TPA: methyltransferase domain-containing protein [Gemmatimonadales bacterium]|nr:methyltransferase domain-containing protein [Gemmatimonadales bacterium]